MGFASMHLSQSEALAFLPHPPSPPRAYSAAGAHPPEAEARPGRHVRSGSHDGSPARERKRHSRSRSRAPSSEMSARYKALSESSRLSGCSLADDLGCLGGF